MLCGYEREIATIRSFWCSDTEAIAELSEGLDAAFEKLQDTGEPDVVRERIATRIIAAARAARRGSLARSRAPQAGLAAPDGRLFHSSAKILLRSSSKMLSVRATRSGVRSASVVSLPLLAFGQADLRSQAGRCREEGRRATGSAMSIRSEVITPDLMGFRRCEL
jgi:hypothetical protein